MFAAIVVIFAWASSGSADAAEGFETGVAAATAAAAAAAGDGLSDATFDAYVRVHGKPPLPEALQHYRKIAASATPPLTETQMVERIKRDADPGESVDAELQLLKARTEAAAALSAPVVPADPGPVEQNAMLVARLEGISAQLNDITASYAKAADKSTPKGLESFINFR
jgi:hypothetical protein